MYLNVCTHILQLLHYRLDYIKILLLIGINNYVGNAILSCCYLLGIKLLNDDRVLVE